MVLLLILSSFAWSSEFNDSKYDVAKKATLEATLKATGLEADFLKVKSAAEGKGRKYLRERGLEPLATFVGFTYTSIIKHKIRGKSGNLLLEVDGDKSQLTWGFQF